jgi:ATP-dependent RNA helicase DeaD
MQGLVEQYQQEHDVPALEIAAALAKMSIGDRPLLMKPDQKRPQHSQSDSKPHKERGERRRSQSHSLPDDDKERYRIEVGHEHGVKPGNIVGAIANEAGLDGQHIGQIEIESDFSLVDLPVGMPNDILADLKKTRVCGQPLNISRVDSSAPQIKGRSSPPPRKKGKPKPSARKEDGSKPHSRKRDGFKQSPRKPGDTKFAGRKKDGLKPGTKAGAKPGPKKEAKSKSPARKKGKPTLSVKSKGPGRSPTQKRNKTRR